MTLPARRRKAGGFRLPHDRGYNAHVCSFCGEREDSDDTTHGELMWVEALGTHVHEDEVDAAFQYAAGATP